MFTAFSRWRQRTFTPRNGPAAGITFHMWESDGEEIRGELAINGQKIHLNGRSSLTIAEDQYRYGDELIAQVFVKDGSPVLLERVSDGYARVQVYLGQADLDTADTLTQIAERIREIQARKASS